MEEILGGGDVYSYPCGVLVRDDTADGEVFGSIAALELDGTALVEMQAFSEIAGDYRGRFQLSRVEISLAFFSAGDCVDAVKGDRSTSCYNYRLLDHGRESGIHRQRGQPCDVALIDAAICGDFVIHLADERGEGGFKGSG